MKNTAVPCFGGCRSPPHGVWRHVEIQQCKAVEPVDMGFAEAHGFCDLRPRLVAQVAKLQNQPFIRVGDLVDGHPGSGLHIDQSVNVPVNLVFQVDYFDDGVLQTLQVRRTAPGHVRHQRCGFCCLVPQPMDLLQLTVNGAIHIPHLFKKFFCVHSISLLHGISPL